MAVIFDKNVSGEGTVGTSEWIAFPISLGIQDRFGISTFTSTDKSITFEIRTNLAGKTSGTEADTLLLGYTAVTTKTVTKTLDLYRKGRSDKRSVVGTSTGEKWWLRLKSKSGAQGAYMYSINYMEI